MRDDDGALTPVAALLLEPWTAGRVGVVNAFGTGVADDKLVHAHVEDMVRLYLGEEPLVESVPTIDLGVEGALDEVLADLRAHVIKPRLGHGGHGVVVCGHAERGGPAPRRGRPPRRPGRLHRPAHRDALGPPDRRR